ncbi:hypothetical protein [Marinobacterium nitratireducens]|nr:hypothetical protein [Marinobacterium nitratireducens]
MRLPDLLQFNLRLLLRQRFRRAMSLLAIKAGGRRLRTLKYCGGVRAHL